MANVIQNNEGEWVLRVEWHINDVRQIVDMHDIDPPILVDDDDCINILKIAADRHDANIGINWEVLQAAADVYADAIANETPIFVKGIPLTNNGVPVWE